MSESKNAELTLICERKRTESFDLDEFAHNELESAKESLREEGSLAPIAWIINATDIYVYSLWFEGAEQKHEIYGRLVALAKEVEAEAIMMSNDTRYIPNPDMQAFHEGKLSFEGAKEAICVFLCGPTTKTKELRAKYERVGDRIVFSPTEEEEGTQVNLLGSWSKELREIQ